jgi:hypothetical protein
MPESYTAEVAQELAAGAAESHAHQEIVEILEAVLLAVVAIATAWSGYQAAKWDGRQSELFGLSSKNRFIATQAQTRGGQERVYDAIAFDFWLQERSADKKTSGLFVKRFRPEYRPAFVAWLATHPFTNPRAPAGPIDMPQYHNAQEERATLYEQRAAADFERGLQARENGDKYVRNTVLLATVLFLIAVAQRFKIRNVRYSLLGVAFVLLAAAVYFVVTYPVA